MTCLIYFYLVTSQQVSQFMNELKAKGPINLEDSGFMPKQDIKKLEEELEDIKKIHEESKQPVTKIEARPIEEVKKVEPKQPEFPSQTQVKLNIDQKQLHKIQYVGMVLLMTFSSHNR
jgi:hypothetical protein